jgi:hypothetical protein
MRLLTQPRSSDLRKYKQTNSSVRQPKTRRASVPRTKR